MADIAANATNCRNGDFTLCEKEVINGMFRDGGYVEYATLISDSVCHVPKDMDPAELAPLLCAGLTPPNAIRRVGGASPGDIVAVQGIGGLGHLAIQYCRAMGYRTVAISSTSSKHDICIQLGARYFVDQSQEPNVGAALLREAGGKAKLVICTAPNTDLIPSLFNAMAPDATLLLLCLLRGSTQIPMIPMSILRCTIRSWAYGTLKDMQETIMFSRQAGIKAIVEIFPLDEARDAYEHRLRGLFRPVIVP